MTKELLLSNLHELVSHNVIGDKQLKSRYKGFKAELEFEKFAKERFKSLKLYNGGLIISKTSNESSLNDAIYVTIVEKNHFDENDYLTIYKSLSKLKFIHMYIVIYDSTNWIPMDVMNFPDKVVNLEIPPSITKIYNIESNTFIDTKKDYTIIAKNFIPYKNRGKNRYDIPRSVGKSLINNLSEYELIPLCNIYFERLIFDGLIGFAMKKGKMSDIDIILKTNDGSFELVEIKEKDLPKRAAKGFGLDVPRLQDMIRIEKVTSLRYHLVIRHINNQRERRLINWKAISINAFANNVKHKKTIEGGTGMRSSNSYNPTLICDFDCFKVL